ncbi:MAG TPA: penicillin-binding protein 1B [Gammaproteobacteria bacterium]|nr:penicillin-binding protein 1B [Gammaproteobacteria bacterium]
MLDYRVRVGIESLQDRAPTRFYARNLVLTPSAALTRARIVYELDLLGYVPRGKPAGPGEFSLGRHDLELWPRTASADCRFPLRLTFDDASRLQRLSGQDGEPCSAELEPFEFANLADATLADREYLPLGRIPPQLVAAFLAIEDRNYYRHPGLDPFALLRATWVNLRAGELLQGGSTLTQQLAKNLYTGGERSWLRKLSEFAHVIVLEWRYDKQQLLEAYLNDIYLGQDGSRAIRGVARGARHWFGRPLVELELHQIALLAGMARGAAAYDPRRSPERARLRRNEVLDALSSLGWASAAAIARARSRPLDVTARPLVRAGRFPSLQRMLREQLDSLVPDRGAADHGLYVRTGIDTWLQMRAEWAVTEALDRHVATVPAARGVQAAVVVIDAKSGALRALVGGRDQNPEAFNRALAARRPIGSLMKPLVTLAALAARPDLHPASRFDDAPPALQDAQGLPWRPGNHDGRRYGIVTLAEALSLSLNAPFVRLAMEAGLPRVANLLTTVGAPVAGHPWPSLALGAHEMSPVAVARAYLLLSAERDPGGIRWIDGIHDRTAKSLWRASAPDGPRADPAALMVRSMMLEVARRGTGRRLTEAFPAHGPLAAKTGTTDERRDSWFVGFGADHLGVTWVGHDDNRPTGLTGAMGALPLWLEVFAGHPPRAVSIPGYAGLLAVFIDGVSGARVSPTCARGLRVLLPKTVVDALPTGPCH